MRLVNSNEAAAGGKALLRQVIQIALRTGPQNKLPSERVLADQLGVSRPTVRTRLSMLEGVGAIERRRGAGTFLRALRPSDLAGVLELTVATGGLDDAGELRSALVALEAEAVFRLAEQQDAEVIAKLERIHRETVATSQRHLYPADLRFHQALIASCGDTGVQFTHGTLIRLFVRDDVERRRRFQAIADDPAAVHEHHEAIIRALQAGKAQRAAAELRRAPCLVGACALHRYRRPAG